MAVVARVPHVGSAARRVLAPLGAAAAAGVTTLALQLRDPHVHGSLGLCPFKAITGWDCPGCGGLRAVNDLTRGDVAGAISSNLLLVSSLPVLAVLWTRSFAQRWRGVRRPLPQPAAGFLAAVAVVVVLVFWVVRNLPFAAVLAP